MKQTVVSILSRGHSGSTLLDIILGSIPGVFSMGEVRHLPYQVFRSNEDRGEDVPSGSICTCGQRFVDCDVWGAVLRRLSVADGVDYVSNPHRLKLRLIGNMYYGRAVTRLNRMQRELFCRSVAAGNRAGNGIVSLLESAYRQRIERNWRLFEELGRQTGDRVLVDSTKDIVRFCMMSKRSDVGTIPIVLIRSARGIVGSALKYGTDPAFELNAWLKSYNDRILPMLRSMHKDYILVDYDEMASDPAGVRARVADELEIDAGPMPESFCPNEYHLVAGNPMRYKSEIVVKYDDSWKMRLNDKHIAMADVAQSKLKL